MIVLGIDTSGYANAVGVVDGEKVLADFNFEARVDSLEKIVANIDYAIQTAGIKLADVKGIGVGLGPGSWTGIRVGVTVGKILAFSADKPVCGVPTLEAMAYEARIESSLLCPVISAGTGEAVYAAFYRSSNANVTRDGEYYVGDVSGLARMVKEPTLFVGTGINSYFELIRQETGSLNIDLRALEREPRGSAVAVLAEKRLNKGDNDDVFSLTPLYLKESTARALLGRYSGNARVNK